MTKAERELIVEALDCIRRHLHGHYEQNQNLIQVTQDFNRLKQITERLKNMGEGGKESE